MLSTDGGAQWEELYSPGVVGCYTYRDIDARNDTVAAVGVTPDGGLVSISRDGGLTFEDSRFQASELYEITSVAVLDGGEVVISGTNQFTPWRCRVFRTGTGVVDWKEVSLPESSQCLYDLTFVSATRGYAIAQNNTYTDPRFAITDDGGKTWQLEKFGANAPEYLFQIFAAADGTVYAVNYDGLFRRNP